MQSGVNEGDGAAPSASDRFGRHVVFASKALVFLAAAAILVLAAPGPARAPWVRGAVRQVDPAARTVTIQHDAIPNLCMEPMTMMFAAANAAMLMPLKVGDRVAFTVEDIDNHPVVTRIEKRASAPHAASGAP